MIASAPEHMKRFHELLFTHGNITFRYHMLSREVSPTEEDWREWLEGLPENIRKHAEEEGFENCRMLSFTRYVMEKNDVGMDEYLRQHMDKEDYEEYMSYLSQGKDSL